MLLEVTIVNILGTEIARDILRRIAIRRAFVFVGCKQDERSSAAAGDVRMPRADEWASRAGRDGVGEIRWQRFFRFCVS